MYSLLLVLLIIVIAVAITFVGNKAKEHFSSVLTDDTVVAAIEDQQKKCTPLYDALGGNDSDMPLSQEFRILSSATQGSNVCMIRSDDAIFSQGNSNCDITNPRLYDPKFSEVIDNIYTGNEIDPDHSTIAGTDVCYFSFVQGATPDSVIEYGSYLNSQDPNIQSLTTEINEANVQYASLSNTLNQVNLSYQTATNNLNQSQLDLATCQASAGTCQANAASFSNQAFACAASLGTCASQLQAAQSEPGPFNPQQNMIQTTQPGVEKCVDITGISKDDWATAQLWDCWNGPNQNWTMDDKMRLVSKNSGKCLDLYMGGTQNGNYLIQYGCHDGSNMKWIYDNKGRLRNYKDPTKCLDIGTPPGGSTYDNGNTLVIQPCGTSQTQVWKSG